MMQRVGDVESSISMTFVHGSHSWIDNRIGYEVKYMRSRSFVDVQVCCSVISATNSCYFHAVLSITAASAMPRRPSVHPYVCQVDVLDYCIQMSKHILKPFFTFW